MPNPKKETVSVVIPLYNAAPFIADTLQSILAQTYTDLQIYVIDDFSTDGSDKIVQELASKEPRITYVHAEKKGGCPAPNKNLGTRLAQGTYVAYCDNDDWWSPEKITKQVAYLDAHPEVVILGTNVEIVDTEHNTSLGLFWKNPEQITPSTVRTLVLDGPILATTTCMMGRRDYMLTHPFDERFLGSDEYDLSLHTALDNPAQIAILPETLAFWRWHSASLSHSEKAASRALKDETLFAEKILARNDLSDSEREQVHNRVRMVTRRAGNAELATGHRAEALQHYKAAASEGDRFSKLMVPFATILPALAAIVVRWKRNHSHVTPTFR